ncbi:MAG: UMP kinase [Candidatus Magasanikbacteria bacterium]
MSREIMVISLGGSLVVPDDIDVNFLKRFRSLILEQIDQGKRFVMVCGGGQTARNYQNAAEQTTELSREDLDWLGIYGTRINAYLLKKIFKKESHSEVITNPEEEINFKENILVAAGWKPGASTDLMAVLLAKKFKTNKVINLTDIDYVYDKDPERYDNPQPEKRISWDKFRDIIPEEWSPGLSSPFDPAASRKAEENDIEVAIINGSELSRVEDYLKGKNFKGTLIR